MKKNPNFEFQNSQEKSPELFEIQKVLSKLLNFERFTLEKSLPAFEFQKVLSQLLNFERFSLEKSPELFEF